MRLKSIKLAGFKSFVDPTTVSLPSNLCAVVGPNGCGKSNIIDAVRWVMGESSAKHLRGEHMTDVIFNGSSNRKPVGQASVELIFDNSDHTITGEYAAYNEISVKRSVTSDSQSSYFLNGARCRRRDITDIFLGTGLGPRSYSIIEQGMVSRLIESKPEELRVFIEEAAGISKYKERRRETENRIKRTKENLERLTDIRDELERQLQHLQRQAKAAERYKEHKKEERQVSAELQSLRWKALDEEVSAGQKEIDELNVALEASIAEQRRFDADIEKLRSDGDEAGDAYQKIQQTFYGLGNEISRIEQNIDYHKQRRQQLEEDLKLTTTNLEQARKELSEDERRLAELSENIEKLNPELADSQAKEKRSLTAQENAEGAMTEWQARWDEFNKTSADSSRHAEVAKQRINHLENLVERGQQRKQNLEKERSEMEAAPEEEEITALDNALAEKAKHQQQLEERNAEIARDIEAIRQQIRESQGLVNQDQSKLQTLLGRQSSLEALQQAALSEDSDAGKWLEQRNLGNSQRVVDSLRVADGWQQAVETVLGKYLQSFCIDGLDGIEGLESFEEGELHLLSNQGDTRVQADNNALADKKLLDKVTDGPQLAALLSGIYCVETLEEALSLRAHLTGSESIVTADGIWVGQNWLRISRNFDARAGMIQRQQELADIDEALSAGQQALQAHEAELEAQSAKLAETEAAREKLREEMSALAQSMSEIKSERAAIVSRVEQVQEQNTRLSQELSELARQLQVESENIASARKELQTALDQMEKDTQTREELLKDRDTHRSTLEAARQQARQDREMSHQLALRHQTLTAQHQSMQSARERISSQVKSFQARTEHLAEQLKGVDDPLPAMHEELEKKLADRLTVEASMSEAKTKVDSIEHDLRNIETNRQQTQEKTQGVRDKLVTRRLAIEGATVKRSALVQSLKEEGYEPAAVLESLEDDRDIAFCEDLLEKIGNRIQRLGPINLAAIDEYDTQSERKLYLDSQNEELEKALTTLESAIRKIDRETRTRFKETFDKVNNKLQELFPKVFGGGHAYLDMIGEDLLDTGVAIMARPPGKKNSTIHLLSGGEKAMTAIALVFSIFELNPSPFCMLDEVDAPLDDANVERYARLVNEMSRSVQFIFITHNRITMENASQLLGVTMHEPGVSRLVAVDVEEAAELAAM